jgi:mono/diheme cytochrome c family protein
LKRILKWLGMLIVAVLVVGGGFVGWQVMAFDRSMSKHYDIPLPKIERSTDPDVIARGKHLAESVSACATSDCHGADFGGGKLMKMGPLGTLQAPNITTSGRGAEYSDGEIARLVLHGVKRDGTSVRFMSALEINWLPDDDLTAVISYLRSMPPVQKPNGPMELGVLAKVLDRLDKIPLDQARRIDHEHRKTAPAPEPTANYGRFIGQMCQGCHGEHYSGGPIPGAPPSIPVPRNITPDETGIKAYSFGDFNNLLDTGIRQNGQKLDPFMPYEALSKMNELERKALWAFLQTLPPRKFGGR